MKSMIHTNSIVSVPEPFVIKKKKLSGSGDRPVHSVFLRHPWNATIKVTSAQFILPHLQFMSTDFLRVDI